MIVPDAKARISGKRRCLCMRGLCVNLTATTDDRSGTHVTQVDASDADSFGPSAPIFSVRIRRAVSVLEDRYRCNERFTVLCNHQRRTATTDHMASTIPKGHAPWRNP